MKVYLKYIAALAVIANIYYLTVWTIVFNTFTTPNERTNKFLDFFPFGLSVVNLNFLLLVLTISSIVLIIKYNTHKLWLGFALTVQIVSALFYFWQFL